MNEFMDFRLVIADPSLYRHLRGYAACSLPKCRSPIRHHDQLNSPLTKSLCSESMIPQ